MDLYNAHDVFRKIIYLPKKILSVKAGATLISILYSKWLHVSSGFGGRRAEIKRSREVQFPQTHDVAYTHPGWPTRTTTGQGVEVLTLAHII